ncbi:MAG: hypothetical protein VYE15_05610 [Myxococcota bacterium]|nr:hypothetical protein [Myxococcota bacterium]
MSDVEPHREASEPNWRSAVSLVLTGEGPAYWALYALCSVAVIAPFWAGDVLPFQDYAGNMSYVAILSGGDGSLYDRVYNTGGILVPNGVFFWLTVVTSWFFPFVTAGKLMLSVYAVALPLSVDLLLREVGRDRRLALLAFPMVYNSSLVMGFVSYATAIPIGIAAIAIAFRYRREPSRKTGVLLTVLCMLTFIGHAQMYLVLGVMAAAFVLFSATSLRNLWTLCAPFAASLLLFLPWAWEEFVKPPDPTALGGRALKPFYETAAQHFSKWGQYTVARWTDSFDDWVFLGILGLFALGLAFRKPAGEPGEGRRRFTVEAITALLVITFLVIPEHTYVQAAIGSRLVAVVMLVGIAWLSVPSSRWIAGFMAWAAVGLTLVTGVGASRAVAGFNKAEMGEDFIELVDALPDESRLAVIVQDRTSNFVTVRAHAHMYGYHYMLNGGTTYSTFHSYYGRHAFWRDGQEIPFPGRDPRVFLRSRASCSFDYLLTRTSGIPRWQHLHPRVTYVGHSARYSLWKLHHDQIPTCRTMKQEREKKKSSDRVATREVRRELADTLAPTVGHARGRNLRGGWAAPEEGRPRSPRMQRDQRPEGLREPEEEAGEEP